MTKYENNFAKVFARNWYENVFAIKNAENNMPWTYVISDLNGEEIVGTFYKK